MVREMDKAHNYGRTLILTKVSGNQTNSMERVSSPAAMVHITKASSRMGRCMELVSGSILLASFIKDNLLKM